MNPGRALRAVSFAAIAAVAGTTFGEQLPLKLYTTADGLPSDRIHAILPDSHGYLWLGTSDGIARFDGYGFTGLGVPEGLPGPEVGDLLEAGDGAYWAATNRGIVRWNPAREPTGPPASMLVVHPAGAGGGDEVEALLEDGGVLWAGTRDGLYRVSPSGRSWAAERVRFEPPGNADARIVNALARGPGGDLFVGTEGGLFRLRAGSTAVRVGGPNGPPRTVRALLAEPDGPLWVGTLAEGIAEVRRSASGELVARHAFGSENGLAGNHVTALKRTSDGEIWAACFGGVSEIAADRASVRSHTMAQGLAGFGIWSLAEDGEGNLWIGSDDAGVMRLARNGFRRLDSRDGLSSDRVSALFAGVGGAPCAFTRGRRPEDVGGDDGFLECFDGERFHTQRVRLPAGTSYGWGWNQLTLRDSAGEWWVPTFAGLFRFPAVPFERLGQVAPRRVYTQRDGLPSDQVYRLFEDRRGDLWMGLAGTDRPLARWERSTDRIETLSAADGIPAELPMAFAEDPGGGVWIGFLRGGLVRRHGGKSAAFGEREGLPPGSVRALHVDRAGRLWIATSRGGLARVDRPAEASVRFERVSSAQGLASDNAYSLAEDPQGRIYAGTERGLDRVDPASGNVQHFTSDDGLARGVIETCLRDRRGRLWFGSSEGLSWLEPVPDAPRKALPLRVTRVLVNGVREPFAELGVTSAQLSARATEPTSVEIDFVALDFAPGGRPRYQYRVDGLDRDWSAPTSRPSVVYARLPSGAYRFRVRAIANDGSMGGREAEVRFRVLPSFWKRPEVIGGLALLALAAAYALHRSRLKRALAIDRVRTRVATDLHDDVGAGLSEIAILSELPRGSPGRDPGKVLQEIGERARALVDSMSDIVWSTDPRRDDAASLLARIRHFAANALEGRGIAWTLEVAPDFEKRALEPETRRQIYLVLKEALTNVARHSRAGRASIRIAPEAQTLSIEVEDDGIGFAEGAAGACAGHGLANMKARALGLGGTFEADSRRPGGTRIRVRVPLRGRAARSA